MVHISSYVFFDIETTGLPWQERNRTKITELCFVAVAREDLHQSIGRIPPVSKLSLLLNPQRKINPEVSAMTGLTNEFLKNAPIFAQISGTVMHFLSDLPKPVCLVAHNGNTFDFKILLAECLDAKINIPDIYCVDSLVLFRKILNRPTKLLKNDLDENLWPELNVTPEDWEELDKLCSPVKKSCHVSLKPADIEALNITDDEDSDFEDKILQELDRIDINKTEAIKKLFDNTSNSIVDNNKVMVGPSKQAKGRPKKGEFTLSGLYEQLLNKKFVAHRAENDCFALLECVIAKKDDFLPIADDCCKKIVDIKPLQRY